MFNNQINRFEEQDVGGETKTQWQQHLHALYQLFKESLVLKKTKENIRCISREIISCKHLKSKREAGLRLLYFLHSTMDLLMASVLLDCIH